MARGQKLIEILYFLETFGLKQAKTECFDDCGGRFSRRKCPTPLAASPKKGEYRAFFKRALVVEKKDALLFLPGLEQIYSAEHGQRSEARVFQSATHTAP